LTHSLEVGQVGRALAAKTHRELGSKFTSIRTAADLSAVVHAACLAHDIGNPPFGHAGEEAMTDWFERHAGMFAELDEEQQRTDLAHFEGNAQGFRVITQTENHVFSGGMQLTYATLGTFLKYPHRRIGKESKFSVFLSEEPLLNTVATALTLPWRDDRYARHPLAYLVEAADDICYCVLDLEDAVELGIADYERVRNLLVTCLDNETAKAISDRLADPKMFRVNFARMRGSVFAALIEAAVEGFLLRYDDIMQGNALFTGEGADAKQASVFDVLPKDDPRARFIGDSKTMARADIYSDGKKVEIELGAFATLDTLLTEFCKAALQATAAGGTPTARSKKVLSLMGDHAPGKALSPSGGVWSKYDCCRRAIDFVAGATDNYATYLGKQMRGDAFSGGQRP